MTRDAWIREMKLIGLLVNSALSDTFWELQLIEEEVLHDFETGRTPAESIRDAMQAGLVERKEISFQEIKTSQLNKIHEGLHSNN